MANLKEIEEQLKYIKASLQKDTENTLMIDANTYVNHVVYLLSELENAKSQSDQWELKYYRSQKERSAT